MKRNLTNNGNYQPKRKSTSEFQGSLGYASKKDKVEIDVRDGRRLGVCVNDFQTDSQSRTLN